MVSLEQIEKDLTEAMKAKNQLAVDTLRGLKTRLQNEKTKPGFTGEELKETQIVALVRSEVKRRKEAAESFLKGGRQEMADKENQEVLILEKYLPAQMSEADLLVLVEKAIVGATSQDFGKVMGKLKAEVGDKADGATLAKILKERLK